MENLSLRPVAAGDEEFLQDLFFDVRGGEFEAAGMTREQLKPLLAMQYAAQKQSFAAVFPHAEHRIIEAGGEKAGRILTAPTGDAAAHLVDIAVMRSFQGRGIGSFFLKKLQNENRRVTLSVYKANAAAIRLYERLGFAIASEDEMYYRMEWNNAGHPKI